MGAIVRGAKNAFRNTIRTLSVTLILAISIGLALIMMLSYQTVQAKITSVQANIGNVVTVSPAGARGFQGGGEPMTGDQVNQITSLAHVTGVSSTIVDRLTTGTNTNLTSAIDPGTLGRRFGGGDGATGGTNSTNSTRTFTLPISVTGVSDTSAFVNDTSKIASGVAIDPTKDNTSAVIGTTLATKNNLSAGSTFSAYNTNITVAGIFDSGNQFGNSGIYMPLSTVQRLSSQSGAVTEASVTVDSVTNLDTVVTEIKDKLGSDKVDVTSTADRAKQAITPLENIKNISLYSLIGSLVAGAIITLLTMLMIVRERRREIGVLKAIGSSNAGVVSQFVAESLVLTLLGSIVGIIFGVLFSNPVLNALVSSNTSTPTGGGGGGGFARVAAIGGQFGGGVRSAVSNLHATVGLNIIGYGLLAAIGIAIIGSAVPAWLSAKVRPAEVMRGE